MKVLWHNAVPSKQGRLLPQSAPHILKQRLTRSFRTLYLAHAVMSILKAKSFFGSTQSKVGLEKGDKPMKNQTQPSGTPGSTTYPSREQTSSLQAGPSLLTLHTNATPPVTTCDLPPTTVFATSAQSSSSCEQASSLQARTSLWPLCLPVFPSLNSVLIIMSDTQVLINDSCWLRCVIKSESVAFTVEVSYCIKIGDLKKEIQREQAMGILKEIDPHRLQLWKVSAINELQCEVTYSHNRLTLILKLTITIILAISQLRVSRVPKSWHHHGSPWRHIGQINLAPHTST